MVIEGKKLYFQIYEGKKLKNSFIITLLSHSSLIQSLG